MVNASWIDRILARPQLGKFYFYEHFYLLKI